MPDFTFNGFPFIVIEDLKVTTGCDILIFNPELFNLQVQPAGLSDKQTEPPPPLTDADNRGE